MMNDKEMKKASISANPLNEEFKIYDAALIRNIDNFLNVEQRDRDYQLGDPFDPQNSKMIKFRLETTPLEARDTEFEHHLPWSQDPESLRKFNQELLELTSDGEPEISHKPFISPFLAEEISLPQSSSEKEEDIQKIPGFFRN